MERNDNEISNSSTNEINSLESIVKMEEEDELVNSNDTAVFLDEKENRKRSEKLKRKKNSTQNPMTDEWVNNENRFLFIWVSA